LSLADNPDCFFKLRKYLSNIGMIVGCLMLFSMVFLVVMQVILRKVFNSPLSWPEEMVRILLVWISFIGSFVTLYYRQHLVLSALASRLTPAKSKIVTVITNTLVLIVLSVFLIWGVKYIGIVGAISMPTTGIKNVYVYSVMWISIFLMFFELLMQTIDTFKTKPG